MTRAIALDPNLVPALLIRANEYYRLKQYADTIRDYDRVLALDPDNANAYADRGLAKMGLGRHSAAVWDFSESIRRRPEGGNLGMTYRYRAEAYLKVDDHRSAIADFTKAIERQLANASLLMTVRLFRVLYPEYNGVSDEAVARKLWTLFWPEGAYQDFTDRFLTNGDTSSSWLPEAALYVGRGDVYLQLGDFRSAVADFNRVFRAFPDYPLERWRTLSTTANGATLLIDAKTIELPTNELGHLWTKTTNPGGGHSVQGYDVNCRTKQLNAASLVVYNAQGGLVRSTDGIRAWQRVIPGTIGEQLFNGLCASSERP